ncbi:VanZ family protein [Romboutsia weinsteinii]|uniref:VanZ family protein n=1 Tax=Romboutsia weinsteinii TaxID=2020949 RepID=A0A371IYE5_9FIRM|nr:VanZ family protein [Romboutsia weinsteinii]RDY25488.1 VanZ family protein [Romboutsia weinsteinii]
MSISGVIQIARQYLVVGSIVAFLIAILFLVGYFVVYKKVLKGTKKLEISKLALWAIFLIYIIVVLGATLGIRTPGYGGNINLHLFSSYKGALNSFSKVEWRNIILNILMFVPLGILLPLIFKKCRKYWVAYLVGFLATVFLELIQLVTGKGIFELDDIFNNTLGCIIGYGIVMIFILCFIDKKKESKNKSLKLTSLQIPLFATIIAFGMVFINYSKQELGNLDISYIYRQDMSNINVNTKLKFKNKSDKAYVYKAPVGSSEDTLKVANEVFRAVDAQIDESQNNVYDDTIVYRSSDGNYSVWVNYAGLTTWYSDFTGHDSKGKDGLSYEEVKTLVKNFDIELPEKADFKNDGDGNYTISVDMVEVDGNYLDGEFTCTISDSDVVTGFTNNIIPYEKYKEYEIISEQEAYDKILNGEFRFYLIDNNSKIENLKIDIKDVNLSYYMDSKGFYQPVYEFTLKYTDIEPVILIPALK